MGALIVLLSLAPNAAAGSAKQEALAALNGMTITVEEVEEAIGAPLAKLQEQIYLLKRRRLETLIAERLLAEEAAKRGVTVPALLDAEVSAKVPPVSDQEVDVAYQAQKTQLKGDEASARGQVKAQLRSQKLTARRQAYVDSLRSGAQVIVYLHAPAVFRAQITTEGAPFRGPMAAPVTIVEFQDFHCPFCRQVQPTLSQIAARYGERVKLVFRDFPIDQLHPQARKAHEAARCAQDQGKFWAYHDVLYSNPPRARPEDLNAYAREAALDMERFGTCITTRAHQADVQKDLDEGIRAGVTGTPTFFVNGRVVSGAQPLETFTHLIDEELGAQ